MSHRYTLAAAALAALLATASDAQDDSKADGPQPSIEIPEMRYDFGRVFEREKYEHTFIVRNKGNADLVLEDVRPGCGCTVVKFDKTIPPGAEGKIDMSVAGDRVHNEWEKSTKVFSNDPAHRQLSISVAGTEIPYLNIVPEGTLYLHGRYGETIEKQIAVTSNEEDLDFKVTGVTSNVDDKITYRVEPGTKKGEYALHVYKNPKLPTMSTYGSLFIHTNSTLSPTTTMQVQIMTKGSITVSPSSVNFGQVKFSDSNGPGTQATRSVIASKATGKFGIKRVVTSNPEFAAAVEPVAEGQQYRIKVTFVPPARKESGQTEAGELIIHTDDPLEPTIRVQLIARAM